MRKKITLTDILLYIIMLIPVLYLGYRYAAMPATIPIHFNFHGPDAYAEKGQSWIFVSIMTVVSFGIYIFLKNLPAIDPKRTAASSASLVFKIAIIIVLFLTIFQIIIINAMMGYMLSIEKILVPTMSIFFALLGNLMINIKPNYFVGIRLPWTLENEENWRKTHRLGGKLLFAGGILSAILSLFLSYEPALICFIAILSVAVIIPVAFSYRYFKKHQNNLP